MEVGENTDIWPDLVQLARLAVNSDSPDVRLYLAKLVRKYRSENPAASQELNTLLKARPEARSTMLRRTGSERVTDPVARSETIPSGLVTEFTSSEPVARPLLSRKLTTDLENLIKERNSVSQLKAAGLKPSSSVFFVGKPGVGKTLTAKWLAQSLHIPMYVLDLARVMSSLLGQTGTNIKNVLSFARSTPCVLLLDEIDAIAKRRNDDLDIGEMKRIVAVILQEVETWDSDSLLIAATNHPELIDPALWRRFDHLFEFGLPDAQLINESLHRFLDRDYQKFEKYVTVLVMMFEGMSYSEIEKALAKYRRAIVIGDATVADVVRSSILPESVDKKDRIDFAKALMDTGDYSQHAVHDLIGVSRDTLRKYKGLQS